MSWRGFGNVDKETQKYYNIFFEDVAHMSAYNMKNMVKYTTDESINKIDVTELQNKVGELCI